MTTNHIVLAMISTFLCITLASGCASSSDSNRVDGSEQIAGDPNAIICKRQQETGSRMSTRVCKTAGEWEQEREDNVEAIRNATMSPSAPGNAPSLGN